MRETQRETQRETETDSETERDRDRERQRRRGVEKRKRKQALFSGLQDFGVNPGKGTKSYSLHKEPILM